MADVFDYLAWRGDLTFDIIPPNEADRLVLCMLSFMDFADIVPNEIGKNEITLADAVDAYFKKYPKGNFIPARLIPQNMRRFTAALAGSRRFGRILLSGYRTKLIKGNDPDSQMQFAALTVRFLAHLSVIYRGTDDTLVGWKENFNSELVYPIPAQALAASYLEEAASLGLPIAVQGHSKGGNMAVYAAVASRVPTDRILSVHDYDGPGFDSTFFVQERYILLRERIVKFLPEYSIIGLIRESKYRKTVVKCVGKGLAQHNGFHWQYTPSGLERARRMDPRALLLNSRLKRCYAMLPPQERRYFIEGVYRLVSSDGRETVTELSNDRRRLLQNFKALNEKEKECMKIVFAELLRQLLSDGEKRKKQLK